MSIKWLFVISNEDRIIAAIFICGYVFEYGRRVEVIDSFLTEQIKNPSFNKKQSPRICATL